MLKVKASKTQNYAQKDPSLPCVLLICGSIYDLPNPLAHRVVELNGGEIIDGDLSIDSKEVQEGDPMARIEQPEVKVEQPEVKVEQPEVKVEQPEVKVEQPEVKVDDKEGGHQSFLGFKKRKPGQPKGNK